MVTTDVVRGLFSGSFFFFVFEFLALLFCDLARQALPYLGSQLQCCMLLYTAAGRCCCCCCVHTATNIGSLRGKASAYPMLPPLSRPARPRCSFKINLSSVITSGERYTIAGLILRRMAWEEGTAMGPPEPPRTPPHLSVLTTAPVPSLLKSAASAQLDSLVLQVKGLREAIYVRCLHGR